MPMRQGSLWEAVRGLDLASQERVRYVMLEHMLSALDLLASAGICHRDIKPDNILYYHEQDRYVFQLADFGLSKHYISAFSRAGTHCYYPPELFPDEFGYQQSPKMDVWSLFCTMAAVNPQVKFPPDTPRNCDYSMTLEAVQCIADGNEKLAPMVRQDPFYRASAAQIGDPPKDSLRGLEGPRRI